MGFFDKPQPVTFQLYQESLQKFRLSAEGVREPFAPETHRAAHPRRASTRCRSGTGRSRRRRSTGDEFPYHAITQRPAAMYHSWGSMNAWLRQIHTQQPALRARRDLRRARAEGWRLGLGDLASRPHQGRDRAHGGGQLATRSGPGTRSASASGAWALDPDAPEARKGFLLNHLIHELLPPKGDGMRWSNSDPITGQAAWYDLRVRIEKAEPGGGQRAAFPAGRRAGQASARARRTALRAGVGDMTLLPSQPAPQEARPGHRPRRLRRLPCLRGHLQGVEHRRLRRGAVGPGPLRRRRLRHLPQPHPHLRGRAGGRRDRRRGGRGAHRAFPEILPALRGCALRHRLPDRRVLQARATTASCWSTRTSASAAGCAPGPAPMARARWTSPPAS